MNWNSMVTNEEWELIDRYLDGELKDNELRQFEQRLQNDQEWKEKTESCQLIRIGIAESALAEKVKEWTPETTTPVSNDNSKIRVLPSVLKWVAAACVILAIGTVTWWLIQRPGSNEKTYMAFYQPDPGLLTVMGPADAYQFEQAMVHYKAGEYRKAALAWESIRGTYAPSDTLHYFIASAWQAEGEWEKAEENYLIVVKDNKSLLYNDASWYLGLLYLRTDRKAEARKWIEQSSHNRKAELLNAIKD